MNAKTRAARLPRIGLGCAGIRMTPEEFDAIRRSDTRFRYELIRGILVVSRMPSIGEVDPNEELGHLLRTYRDQHPNGSTLDATVPERYINTADSRRRADRMIWAGLGRLPVEEQDLPTIVVEFVSRSKKDWIRDYVEKKEEYLALGIAEYWIIDRFRHHMTAYRKGPNGPEEIVVPAEETYSTPILPGFELSLARLWKVADRWNRPRGG